MFERPGEPRAAISRRPSGLFVVGDTQAEPFGDDRAWGARPSGLLAPIEPTPSMLEQVAVLVDETALGLPQSSIEDVRELLSGLPFLTAFSFAFRLALDLWPLTHKPEEQVRLLPEYYGEASLASRAFELQAGRDGGAQHHLFSMQQVAVFQRLILESAETGVGDEGLTEDQNLHLRQALLGVTSVIGEGAAKIRDTDGDLSGWLGFLTQNGAYNAQERPLEAFVRTWRIYHDLAATPEARAHPSYVPLDEWHRSKYGMGLKDLFAVAMSANSGAQSTDGKPEHRGLVKPMADYLSNTPYSEDHRAFTDVMSGTRDWYVQEFAGSRDNPLRLAWDRTPFLTKPFLRGPGDALGLISPQASQAFLTDGTHYRLLDAAPDRRARDAFTTFVGWLFERYVFDLFAESLGERPPGAGRASPDQTYGGGQRTSDVAIDHGSDLVLCEVVSTRMPLGVRAEADEAELQTFLTRIVTNKLSQLNRVIDDLASGEARLPGVDFENVHRVWPVLITAGDLNPSEPLWDYVEIHAGHYLEQSGVMPLTLLGVGEVELLADMLAAGEDLVDLLRRKNDGAYQRLSLKRFLHDAGYRDIDRSPRSLERWRAICAESGRLLGASD